MSSSAAVAVSFRPASLEALLTRIAHAARTSGVFGEVSLVTASTPGAGPNVQGEGAAGGGAGGGIAGLPMLRCEAKASAEPAFYAIRADLRDAKSPAGGACLWVSLQTGARYLSQSIEADLMFTGDKIDDLVHEEMTDLGYDGPALPFQHFRSEDKLYTFRSPLAVLPADVTSDAGLLAAAKVCEQALLGYEAAFRGLGDMEDAED
jgi:hypothetical protein